MKKFDEIWNEAFSPVTKEMKTLVNCCDNIVSTVKEKNEIDRKRALLTSYTNATYEKQIDSKTSEVTLF